ncbi:Rap1a/Tai family immunity protein [Sphaerotilus mobilis]|nr:Rap1a/Tai family immunity protein [Sphaerotilus mobilis]
MADTHFVTSVDLVTELKNKERLMLGFVTGVHDTLNGVAFCVPNETMPLELVDAILRWAPGRTSVSVSGARMTTQALAAAWPCRRDRMGQY